VKGIESDFVGAFTVVVLFSFCISANAQQDVELEEGLIFVEETSEGIVGDLNPGEETFSADALLIGDSELQGNRASMVASFVLRIDKRGGLVLDRSLVAMEAAGDRTTCFGRDTDVVFVPRQGRIVRIISDHGTHDSGTWSRQQSFVPPLWIRGEPIMDSVSFRGDTMTGDDCGNGTEVKYDLSNIRLVISRD